MNDQYGHKVGDEVICHVAQLMMNSIRQQDIVARFGGEEFVVAITGESPELLTSIFERIQNDINLQSYRCANGDKIDISVSGEQHFTRCISSIVSGTCGKTRVFVRPTSSFIRLKLRVRIRC